jgi:DNA-binding transcriptional MerR regulator
MNLKDLTEKQMKLLETIVKPEKDAFFEWYTGEFNHDWELHNLRNDPKIADKILREIKKLKSLGLTFEKIRKCINQMKDIMWDEIRSQWWWIDEEDMFEAYKELNEPDANYHKLGWTLRLVDSLEEIEKDKSERLERFEFGYKQAVARGDPIDELDEEVKERIAHFLRASKKKKKKSKKKKKKTKGGLLSLL